MTPASFVRGTLDQVIMNEGDLYEGNLVKYFQVIFFNARNLSHPYHNFRHMMHVTWLCHNACGYYSETMTKREMRNLLIAAMFHDFDHRGVLGEDILNIMLAVQGINNHILPEDLPFKHDIVSIIHATEYPYKASSDSLGFCSQIIRDADLTQSLNATWLQQVIFGLALEWKKTPLEVLKLQNAFHSNLKFGTKWACEMWPKSEIDKKIDETSKIIQILEMTP